jgi:hypothetical protein
MYCTCVSDQRQVLNGRVVPGAGLMEIGLIQRIEIRQVATVATPRSVPGQGKDNLRL